MADHPRKQARRNFIKGPESRGVAAFALQKDISLHVNCTDFASGNPRFMHGDGVIYSMPPIEKKLRKLKAALEADISLAGIRFGWKDGGITVSFASREPESVESDLGRLYDAVEGALLTIMLEKKKSRPDDWWKRGESPPEWGRA